MPKQNPKKNVFCLATHWKKNNCSYLKANYAIANIIRHKDVCIFCLKYCLEFSVSLSASWHNSTIFRLTKRFYKKVIFHCSRVELQRQCFLVCCWRVLFINYMTRCLEDGKKIPEKCPDGNRRAFISLLTDFTRLTDHPNLKILIFGCAMGNFIISYSNEAFYIHILLNFGRELWQMFSTIHKVLQLLPQKKCSRIACGYSHRLCTKKTIKNIKLVQSVGGKITEIN